MPPLRAVRRRHRVADRQAGSRHQVPGLNGAGGRSRPVRQPLRRHSDHQGPLHQGDSDAAGDPGVAQGRAPRAVVCRGRSRIDRSDRATTARAWTAVSSSSSTHPARTPKSIRTMRASCSRPARRRWSAITCTRSAKRRRRRSSSASRFIPKGYVPKHIRWSKQLAQPTAALDIPAGTVARVDGYTVLHKPARIIAFQPHMHIRGKRQCLELIYPTSGSSARTEVVNCANFNYNWHLTYNYADDAQPLVPAGTILHTISWHDNSAANKSNPDPRNWVGDGQRTIDEMGFAWIGWYDLTDEEYKTQLAERKELQRKTTTTTGSNSSNSSAATAWADLQGPPAELVIRASRRSLEAGLSQEGPAFFASRRFVCQSHTRCAPDCGGSRDRPRLPRAGERAARDRQQLQVQLRSGHSADVRRVVACARRRVRDALRLSESQLGAGALDSGRPRQQHRAGRTGSRAADVLLHAHATATCSP